jgi:hypothetical protein
LSHGEWTQVRQGLIGKKVVGIERTIDISPGQAEQDVVNGLVMDIFNLFIARKLEFEKRERPPMDTEVRYKQKDLLFVYSLDGGSRYLLALASRSSKVLVSVTLMLTPAPPEVSHPGSDPGWETATILDGIKSPYMRRG